MSMLDDAAKAVQDFADTAEKKGKAVCKISKLKVREAMLNNKLSSKYEELGKACYVIMKSGSESFDSLFDAADEIDGIIEELDGVINEQAEAKGAVRCPSCKAVNKSDSSFCSKCGEKLD